MGKLNLEYFMARRMATPTGGRKNNVMVRIATLSVAIGMAVMIVSLGVIFGFKQELAAKLSGFGAHVQLVNLDGNTSFETVPISRNQNFLPEIRKIKNFDRIAPYALTIGIPRGKNAIQAIVLKGVDSTYDWSFFRDHLVAGELPDLRNNVRSKEIVISRSLADLLEVAVGDPLEMLFIQEQPRRNHFRVKGIYDTQYSEMDHMMALTDIRNVQKINEWDSTQITGFEIMTTDFSQLERFSDDVYEVVVNGTTANHEEALRVINIRERFPMIFDWLDAHNVNAGVIITVMLLVALFNMIAALLIILLERTAMIGVLKALGMGNHALQKMFIIRSSFVILKGMFWGNVIGVGLCLLQHYTGWVALDEEGYFLTTVPIFINWGYLVLMNAMTFLLIVLLLALPTMIISLILPEKTIRFE